jgi:peptide/nickel transport system substrate-binding protein
MLVYSHTNLPRELWEEQYMSRLTRRNDSAGLGFLLLGICLLTRAALGQPAPSQGGTLNVGLPSDTKTMDPVYSVQFTERQVLYLLFNTLVRYGPDFSIHPELAESWKVEDGGKRVTFKLRQGVQFHDGTPFDAAAVKWNIDRRLDPAVASPQRDQLAPLIAAVEVVDARTVAFVLKAPYAGLLSLLGERPGFMLSPTAAEQLGKDFGNAPVGTGPFLFKEWVRGSHIAVERNPRYWEPGKPYLDRIVFRDISGAVVGVQRLVTGEVDFVADLSPQDIKQLQGRSGITLAPITVGRWYALQWHMFKEPFSNDKLRQAIAHGIDRKRINDIVMDGKGTISDGPTPAGLWWFDPAIKSYAYDPEKAKALLKEAGYANGFEFTLSTPQVTAMSQINQLAQEQLDAIGIKLKLEPVAQSEWYAKLVRKETNFSPNRWTQRPDPDGLLYILFHSKGYANTTGYKNDRVDALLEEARQNFDQAERKKLYSEVQAIIARDVPMLPLFFSVEYAALLRNVQGFEWIPDQIPRFRDVWKSK